MITVTTLGIALLAFLHIFNAGPARDGRGRFHVAAFAAGWLALIAALAPPLDALADAKLSAHMVQHELLMVVAAPLIALGRPHLALLGILPRKIRRRAAQWFERIRLGTPVAWILHSVALWLWHAPYLYDAALVRPWLHAAEHASFLGTALLFWWSVLDRRARYGAAALYVFATSLHSGLLGALLFLAPRPWYSAYAGPGALEDQQLAGLVMWILGGVVLAATSLILIARWLDEVERRVAARERPRLGPARPPRELALALVLLAALALPACRQAKATAAALTGGDPDTGKNKIQAYGCWTCHTIPGVPGANAVVGPPLDKIAGRAYVAGRPNSPANLIEWIRAPQTARRGTPMPDMGVTEADARDIAAYLYTLR